MDVKNDIVMNRRARLAQMYRARAELGKGWTPMQDLTEKAKEKGTIGLPPSLIRLWGNNKYTVQEYQRQTLWGRVTLLCIFANSKLMARNWEHLQRIKNEIASEEHQAFELYPREEEMVDAPNGCYYLWVLPKDFEIPFGLTWIEDHNK